MNTPDHHIPRTAASSAQPTPGPVPCLPFAINGRYLTRRTTGVERVARGIVDALDARVDADGLIRRNGIAFRPRLLAPPGEAIAPPARIPVQRGAYLSGNAWEQFELPWAARGDLLLNLCNTAPLLAGAQCTYVHDAGVYAIPASYQWRFRAWYRVLHLAYRWRRDALLTNSAFSAGELQRWARFPNRQLQVAMPGCNHVHAFADAPLPDAVARLASGRGYYVVVGSRARHKCIGVAIEAHRLHLRRQPQAPALVMIGGDRRDIFGHDAASDGADDDSRLHLGYLDDAALVAILRHARALIFPSRYEGFGLPLTEAMALGCPVVASDLPTVHEIGIDACWTFPVGDADGLAARLADVDTQPTQVLQRARAGRRRAAQLHWDACADAVLHALALAAGTHRETSA